jgi:MFS family permease
MTQVSTSFPAQAVAATPAETLRTKAILAVIFTGQFMAVLDAFIVNIAVPSMRQSLHAGGSAMQLVVSGYVVAYAVLLVTGARLGDRITQRRAFTAGLALFTVASLACGLAWNTEVLIGFRVAQGVGAAVMVPQVMTLIQRTFTGATRARALSIYAAVISGGGVAGQVLGGLIVTWAGDSGWRGVFLVNVPIGLVLLVAAPRVLPRGTGVARKLDLIGLVLLAASVLAFVLPLVLGHQQDWPAWCWITLGLSVIGLAGFVVAQRWVHRRGGEPLFADQVVRAAGLLPAAFALFLVMVTVSGSMFTMALHVQSTLGYSAIHAGLLFIPTSTAMAVLSMNWSKLPATWQGPMIPLGMVLAAACIALVGQLLREGGAAGVAVVLVWAVQGAAFGISFSPMMNRALTKVPPAVAADASGILVTGAQLGMVVGVATYGSLYLSLIGHSSRSAAHALATTTVVEAVGMLLAAAIATRVIRR